MQLHGWCYTSFCQNAALVCGVWSGRGLVERGDEVDLCVCCVTWRWKRGVRDGEVVCMLNGGVGGTWCAECRKWYFVVTVEW